MASEKFVFKTELDIKGLTKQAKQAQREIREIGNQARATSKQANITGDVKIKAKGIDETTKALKLAKENVKQLTEGLSQAKMNGATTQQVQGLESQLRKASVQATNLKTDLIKMSQGTENSGKMFDGINAGAQKVKGSLIQTAGSIGNIFSGVMAGVNLVKSGFDTVTGLVGGFATSLMDTYDGQVQAQKTLSATLTDGAKGYETFNANIEKGNALLKSQKGDLNELAATLSGYTQMSGEQAFDTVNAINAIGDSLSVSMDGQKQFSLALAQALGAGALHAQDFNQMIGTALGAEFKKTLIEATNSMNGVKKSASDMKQELLAGKVDKNFLSSVLGDDWSSKMAKFQTETQGIKVSAGGVSRALKAGAISVEDFGKVFGGDFLDKITQANNASGGMVITQENFKQAMEDGAFGTQQMNKALEMFQEKGGELANNGPATFAQIKDMITKGFDQSALAGFQDRMTETGVGMDDLGNSAGELASMAGTAMGQLAADAVNAVTKMMDKNGDGKVSNEEFQDTFNQVKGEAEKFFNTVNSWDIGGFLGELGAGISKLVDFYNTIDDAWGKFNGFAKSVGGKSGLLGKMFGVDDWFDGSTSKWFGGGSGGGGRGFLMDNFTSNYNMGLGSRKPQAMEGMLPLYLQQFASVPDTGTTFSASTMKAIPTNVLSTAGTNNATTIGDIIINTTASDGKVIADEIYRRLGRNGVKLPRR